MTHEHTKYYILIIHIFESARTQLHFLRMQDSRMSDTGILHEEFLHRAVALGLCTTG